MPSVFPIVTEHIEKNIYTIRGNEVMIDSDIASIYDVETNVNCRYSLAS